MGDCIIEGNGLEESLFPVEWGDHIYKNRQILKHYRYKVDVGDIGGLWSGSKQWD